jgi:hypothetical protein
VSSRAISGRRIAGEARFGTWLDAWSTLDGPIEKFFGAGVGTGTNGTVALLGTRNIAGGGISDSTFMAALLGLGIVGLLTFIGAYVALWPAVRFDRRITLLPMVGLTALTFNVVEVSPFNILLAVALGCSMGSQPAGSGQATGKASPSVVKVENVECFDAER